jgi:hypothetical protein
LEVLDVSVSRKFFLEQRIQQSFQGLSCLQELHIWVVDFQMYHSSTGLVNIFEFLSSYISSQCKLRVLSLMMLTSTAYRSPDCGAFRRLLVKLRESIQELHLGFDPLEQTAEIQASIRNSDFNQLDLLSYPGCQLDSDLNVVLQNLPRTVTRVGLSCRLVNPLNIDISRFRSVYLSLSLGNMEIDREVVKHSVLQLLSVCQKVHLNFRDFDTSEVISFSRTELLKFLPNSSRLDMMQITGGLILVDPESKEIDDVEYSIRLLRKFPSLKTFWIGLLHPKHGGDSTQEFEWYRTMINFFRSYQPLGQSTRGRKRFRDQ